MQNEYYTAVVDFGKTNKKVLVYDRDMNVCDTRREVFEEVEIEGYRCDDIEGAMSFVFNALEEFAARWSPLRAISFTTHGATFECVDEAGDLVFPPVSYDMDPPGGLREKFHDIFGSKAALQQATMTPPLPFILNPGFGIFFLKEHDPERFRRVRRILFLPQYLGALMTGQTALEPTYVGCHTYLWDFEKNGPSDVARGLEVADKLGVPWKKPWEVQGTVKPELVRRLGLPEDCIVTCGIHDSNASLLPYILKQERSDFVLNSTGTWCVAMSPGGRFPLADDEIGKEVFFNLSVFGEPVKTTIFRGGAEFAAWVERLGRGEPHPEELDRDMLKKVMDERVFVLPTLFPGSGMFPDTRASLVRADLLFEDPLLAFMALDLSLAIQSHVAVTATTSNTHPDVFIEGGFRNNKPYMAILSALFAGSRVYLSDLAEATAFGAAILNKCAVEGCEPAEVAGAFSIETTEVAPVEIPGLDRYVEAFHRLTGQLQ